MHGLLSSSDCWILTGVDTSLAYILSNAGYDVWMGNARGNTYSKHNSKLSSLLPGFWDFSWNEIAINDLPAMFDYVRYTTGLDSFHYVAHSQGTTAYFALLSSIPKFNSYIKTGQLLAPVGFMSHMKSSLAKLTAPVFGKPNIFSSLVASNELMPNSEISAMLGDSLCRENSPFQEICGNILFLIVGWDSEYLNTVSIDFFFSLIENFFFEIFLYFSTDRATFNLCNSSSWGIDNSVDSLPSRIQYWLFSPL